MLAMPSATTRKPWRRLVQHGESPAPESPITSSTDVSILGVTSRDPDQAYYWTPEWQNDEEEARGDILAGRVSVLNNPDEVEAHFSSLTKRCRQSRRRRT